MLVFVDQLLASSAVRVHRSLEGAVTPEGSALPMKNLVLRMTAPIWRKTKSHFLWPQDRWQDESEFNRARVWSQEIYEQHVQGLLLKSDTCAGARFSRKVSSGNLKQKMKEGW